MLHHNSNFSNLRPALGKFLVLFYFLLSHTIKKYRNRKILTPKNYNDRFDHLQINYPKFDYSINMKCNLMSFFAL